MRRNDIIPIDSRSHLEVADRKHRYAKNLRVYFKEYHRLNGITDIIDQPTSSNGSNTPSRKLARYNPFFDWLDNEESQPNLSECPRTILDEDKVEYLTTDAERAPYEITINGKTAEGDGDGLWRLSSTGEPVNTGPKGWIFVLLFDRMYACEKRTSTFPRFHHSSFFAGAGVSAAGMVVCVNGRLTKLFPHSGHYRPHDRHLYLLLGYLRDKGVDLSAVQVDVQRVMKLSRQTEKDGAKARKTECAMYLDGETAYNFLRSKNSFLEGGVLKQINKRRLQASTPTASSSTLALATASTDGVSVTVSSIIGATSGDEAGPMTIARAASTESTAAQSISDIFTVGTSTQLNDGPSCKKQYRGAEPAVGQGVSNAACEGQDSSKVSVSRDMNSGGDAESKRQSGDCATDLNRSVSSASTASPFCSPVTRYQYAFNRDNSDNRVPSPSIGCSGNSVPSSSSSSSGRAVEGPPQQQVPSASASAAVFPVKSSVFSSGSPGSGDDQLHTAIGTNAAAVAKHGLAQNAVSSCSNSYNSSYSAGNLGSGLHISCPSPGSGPSAAESRARVLGNMLYAGGTGNAGGVSGGGGGHKKGHSGTLPVSPPIASAVPAVTPRGSSTFTAATSATATGVGTGVYASTGSSGIAGSPGQMKIPVPAPIKKVTSHTSISSSYGSTSYIASYFNRSRSASKADDGLDYDIRVLLGDSPVVPVPMMDNTYFYTSADALSTGSPVATSAGNSACQSRTRSRCSSFNPPFPLGGGGGGAYANSNFNYAITESSVLHRLNSSGSGGNSVSGTTSVYYATTGAGVGEYSEEFQVLINGGSGSGSVGGHNHVGSKHAAKDPSPSSSADNSPADKLRPAAGGWPLSGGSVKSAVSPTTSATASLASSRGAASVPAAASSVILVDTPRGYGSSSSADKDRDRDNSRGTPSSRSTGSQYHHHQQYQLRPDEHLPAVSAPVSAGSSTTGRLAIVLGGGRHSTSAGVPLSPECDMVEMALAAQELHQQRDVECPSSPVPSFASSLSSTDSMSNMLELLMSPAGAQQRRRDSRGDSFHYSYTGGNREHSGEGGECDVDVDGEYSFSYYQQDHVDDAVDGGGGGEGGLLPE